MFGARITLFKLMGFSIRIDASWLIIAVLVTWSLASGLFPSQYEGLSTSTYWWMGVIGAFGLFLSIVLHEVSHSFVATQYGLPIKGITLFIFGGVAEMDEEPPNSKVEFFMAVAGPITSGLLALIFYALSLIGRRQGWGVALPGVLGYLAFINGILAAFNLVPGFPLDGGRMLRSALWYWKDNLRWATHIASRVGAGFGVVLIILGVLNVISGQFIGGMWWFLIGLFLYRAATQSYQQVLIRQALQGQTVEQLMNSDPVTVSPTITLEELVEDYIYRHHFKMFPVVENGKLVGCVSLEDVKEAPRDEWKERRIQDLMHHCSRDNTIQPKQDAMKALTKMSRTQTSRLMVVEGDELKGIIALRDMLELLSLRSELDESEIDRSVQ